MSSQAPVPSSAPVDDRLILTPAADEDDASRDARRSADAGDKTSGQAADNAYLQSAHQGGMGSASDEDAQAGAAAGEEDGVAYTADDAAADAAALLKTGSAGQGQADSGSFVYDAGAHFPELDMSGPASFAVEGPDWAAIDPATGLLTGAPGVEDLGVFTFTVTAVDAAGESFTTALEFTVESEGGVPVVSDVFVKPAAEDAPSTDAGSETPAQDAAAPEAAPSDGVAGDDAPLADQPVDAAPEAPVAEQPPAEVPAAPQPPVQDAAPSAPEAPVSEQPPAVEPPAAPQPPVQDAAPSAPEAPVSEQPPVAEPPAAPQPPVQEAAPSAPEAPVAEQPPAVEPPPAPQPPVQDAAPSAPEAPVAEQPPAVEPPAAPQPPVQDAAPSAPEAPVAEQPPAIEPPSAPAEPPVQETAPAQPEPPATEEPPVAEPPVSPPPAPEPPVQAAPPVAPPVAPSAPPAPKTYNVITGTKNADTIVGTSGDDQITGGRGNDKLQGGAGDDLYIYKNDSNGSDVFDDGKADDGYDVVQVTDAKVVIGVDGYNDGRSFTSKGVTVKSTGVDEFQGAGDTIIRDGGSARTLDFSHTKLGGVLEVDAGGGNDKVVASDLSDASYRGGAGNDALTAGDAKTTWLYSGASNGSDTFVNGDGFSEALAQGKGVVIGLNGYANGVDAFEGAGDTIVRDGSSSKTLDFSNTALNGVLEVDAGGGNDKVVASDLSAASYRGGAGDDSLTAGDADATWLYKGSSNGNDSFVNGEGFSVAQAEGSGVVIGLNGYANGVDAFEGAGDTIVRDGGSSKTLNFSSTEITGVLEIDAGGGNDTVVASDLSVALYRGGAGDDSLTAGQADATWLYKGASNGSDTFVNGEGHSVAQAEGSGVVIGLNGYANGVDAFEGAGDTIVRDGGSSKTLNFSSTELNGVLEVDAGGGNDTLLASNLSDASYRGGAGNDALTAGSQHTTWLYGAGDNGHDTFTNGSGVSVAAAEGSGVVIGLNGYANGVDGFKGAGDTVLRDGGSSKTLDFSNTAFKDIALVDAGAGNDTVTASNLSEAAYMGGAGNDAMLAGAQRTVFVYGAGDNGLDSFTNGAGQSLAQADGEDVVIGVNGYANGVDGFLGAGDTIIRDGGSGKTLDFSNTALKGVAEIDGAAGNDTITVSNLSEGSYRGGAGNDVFVVQKGAASAVIADFDDAGADRIDLSAFGSNRGAIQASATLVDSDGDGQVDDVQIDLGALGGEKGATLTLLDTDMSALNFAAKGDFTVAGNSGAKFANGQTAMPAEGDVDQLFAFDMDTLDASSGWTAALDAPAARDADADAFMDGSEVVVFDDGADSMASINDSQW